MSDLLTMEIADTEKQQKAKKRIKPPESERGPSPGPGNPPLSPVSPDQEAPPSESVLANANPYASAPWMAEAKKWAAAFRLTVPRVKSLLHPTTVEAVLKDLCETKKRCMPNYRAWVCDPAVDLPTLVYRRVTSPGFLDRHALTLGLLLGSSVTNEHWAACVLINLALHEAIESLVGL